MEYREHDALVSEIRKDSVVIFIPCKKPQKCRACAGYGACAAPGSSNSYVIPVDNPEDFTVKEAVRARLAAPPFLMSIFFVFILPVILMVLFPAAMCFFSKNNSGNEIQTVTAGIIGLAAALLIGRRIDRKFSGKHPAGIRKPIGKRK